MCVSYCQNCFEVLLIALSNYHTEVKQAQFQLWLASLRTFQHLVQCFWGCIKDRQLEKWRYFGYPKTEITESRPKFSIWKPNRNRVYWNIPNYLNYFKHIWTIHNISEIGISFLRNFTLALLDWKPFESLDTYLDLSMMVHHILCSVLNDPHKLFRLRHDIF